MKNDNRKNFSSHRELFDYATWGGGGPLLTHESEGSTSFSSKPHNFKATGGATKGRRMGGRLNGGADGGAIFGIHGGAQEGRWIHI